MSTIAATTSSASESLLSLLNSSASAKASSAPSPGADQSATSAAAPASQVELSDRAKAVLARDKFDRVAANRLAQQVAAKTSKNTTSQSTADPSNLFDALSGRSPQATIDVDDPVASVKDPGAYALAQQAAHTNADGSISSWSTSGSNVINVPSTPQEIDQWYRTEGQRLLSQSRANAGSVAPGLVRAIEDRTLTFSNALDVPDLNFRNSFSFQGGEGGAGGGVNAYYNLQSSIFKNSTFQSLVQADGTVLSWAA